LRLNEIVEIITRIDTDKERSEKLKSVGKFDSVLKFTALATNKNILLSEYLSKYSEKYAVSTANQV